MGLHYATQLYRPPQEASYQRLLEGIASNLMIPGIDHATIFLDGCEPPWEHPSVRWVPLHRRATFADFLELATGSAAAEPSSHLLFANSDIVFDAGITRLTQVVSQAHWAICLTRRELDGCFPAGIEPLQTQDAWLLMRQPVPRLLLDLLQAVRLGVAGSEHLFAAALVAHGFALWNPCEDCLVLHSDPAPVAHGPKAERYWGLYAYVPACWLADVGHSDPLVLFAYACSPGRYYPAQIG